MRVLRFSVNGQKLRKDGDFSQIVRGSKKYLRCEFVFKDNSWHRNKIAAVFEHKGKEYAVPVGTTRECMVPDDVTDFSYFKMRLVGLKDGTTITTNKILIEQE